MERLIRSFCSLVLGLALALPALAQESADPSAQAAASTTSKKTEGLSQSGTISSQVLPVPSDGEEEKGLTDLRYLSKEELKTYKIRPADVISVDVYNEPDLSRDVQVDRKGFVNYPLIGRFKVEGLTQEEVEKKVRDLFAKDYLVNPLISMRFVVDQTPTPVSPTAAAAALEEEEVVLVSYIVLGEVKKPGTYEFNPEKGKMSLLKAVSIAGGFSDVANISKIRLLRREGETTKSMTINAKDIISGKKADEAVGADDLIVVPESLI